MFPPYLFLLLCFVSVRNIKSTVHLDGELFLRGSTEQKAEKNYLFTLEMLIWHKTVGDQ